MAYGAKHQIEEKEQKLKLKVTYLSFSQAFSSFLKEFSAFPSLKGKNWQAKSKNHDLQLLQRVIVLTWSWSTNRLERFEL